MPIPLDLLKAPELSDWVILTGWRGSIAHNMYVPGSDPNSIDDKDVMTVCVPPLYHYLGLQKFGSRGTKEVYREISGTMWDIVIYELRKFVSLLTKANPNVLSLLWLEENHYLKRSQGGQLLIDNRDLFSTRRAHKAFTGYAYSQLMRMERGPKGGWQSARRMEMFEEIGYDAKNAAHLIRLLRMGHEFLSTGVLNVFRHDASYLLDIKQGNRSLEFIKEEASRLFDLTDRALATSPLPPEPNMLKVNALMTDVLMMELRLISR